MPFFGGFTQGLAGGLQAGQQMKMQAEEHKLKARMLDFQAKKMEADQQAQEQQQRGMADYVQAATQGVPDQFGGPVQGPIEASGKLPAQPAPQRQATPQELYGLSLKAVPPKDAYHLIQQQQKAQLPGAANASFADVNSALAFQNTPEFQTAFPTGARLQQTSKGWTFQGVNPVNVASNEFHRVLSQTKDPSQALAAYNSVLFGGSAMQGSGSQLGQAAATMGAPIPPPPPMAGRPQAQQPVTPGAPQQPAAPMAQAPQPSGESLPLQAARAKANVTRESANVPEAAAKEMGSLETLLNTTIPDIRKNYDKGAYLGPLQGNETYYGFRRQFGSTIKQPVTDKEAKFRSALSDAADMLLRARSGAQINEQEYKRLAGLLPKATDEPQIFEANLSRFENQLRQSLVNRQKYENMPRSNLGQSQGGSSLPPPPPGWR